MWGDVGDDGLGFHQQQRLGLIRRRAVSPRSPFLPCLGSGQCPVTPESPLQAGGSVQAPFPPALPAHIIPSHPKTKTRPDQPLSPNHHSGSPLPRTVPQPDSPRPGHMVTFSSQPRNGPKGLLSSSLCVLGSVPPLPHSSSALPTNLLFLARILPHFGSLHRDSRHIE